MHITILDANTDTSAFAARHPSELEKFRHLLATLAPDWRYSDYKVCTGDFPKGALACDGVIISGSPASVNSGEAWVDDLCALITDLFDRQIPVFGACFGHQAIARALGGTVGANPQGWVLGVSDTRASAPAEWMPNCSPDTITRQHAAHSEQVLTLPAGGVVISTADQVPFAQIRVGDHVFSTQYHPEITHDFMVELIDEMNGKIDAPALERARTSMRPQAQNDVLAEWIVQFFRHSSAPGKSHAP